MTRGRGTSLDLFTDGLKCAESVLWHRPGGLEAHHCSALQPHAVTVWETEPVHPVAQAHCLLHLHGCLGCNCDYHTAQVLQSFLFLLCKGCWFGLINCVQLNTRKSGGLLGCTKKDKASFGCCFQSLSHGFILQIYSMLHILNLVSFNFSRSPSKWPEVMFISCFGKV